MTAIIILLCAAALFVVTILMIRRNLRQRPMARKFREIFIALADDLVGKPEFPEEHAAQIVRLASFPGGWLTRGMVAAMVYEMATGRTVQGASEAPSLEKVPANLRGKYAVAILALAVSDSYRCALFGRVWRGANSWIPDAIANVKPDVNAHATRSAVAHVNIGRAPRVAPARSFATA